MNLEKLKSPFTPNVTEWFLVKSPDVVFTFPTPDDSELIDTKDLKVSTVFRVKDWRVVYGHREPREKRKKL